MQSSPKSKRYCLTRRKTSTLFNDTAENEKIEVQNVEETPTEKDPDLAELILETQTENCERTRDASSHVPQSDSILMCQTDISSDQFHSLSSYSLLNQVRDVIVFRTCIQIACEGSPEIFGIFFAFWTH